MPISEEESPGIAAVKRQIVKIQRRGRHVMRMIFEAITLIYLGVNTVTDLIWRKISPGLSFIVLGLMPIWRISTGNADLTGIVSGMIPGILLLVLARVMHEQIGYGDGLLVLTYGTGYGMEQTSIVLMTALMGAAVWSVILLIFRRAGKRDSFPFAPFLLAAHLICGNFL